MPDTYTDLANGNGLNVVNLADSAVKGLVVEGQTISDQPVTIGGRVCTSLATRQLYADGESQQAAFTSDGRLITAAWTDPATQVATTPVALTTTGDVTLVAAGASGVRIALVGALIDNVSATDTTVIIKEGSTILGRIPAPKRGSGVAPATFPLPIRGTAATTMQVALSDAATTVYVTPLAYRTKV